MFHEALFLEYQCYLEKVWYETNQHGLSKFIETNYYYLELQSLNGWVSFTTSLSLMISWYSLFFTKKWTRVVKDYFLNEKNNQVSEREAYLYKTSSYYRSTHNYKLKRMVYMCSKESRPYGLYLIVSYRRQALTSISKFRPKLDAFNAEQHEAYRHDPVYHHKILNVLSAEVVDRYKYHYPLDAHEFFAINIKDHLNKLPLRSSKQYIEVVFKAKDISRLLT